MADRLGAAVQGYQAAVDDFDREVARLLGINTTDARCLEILIQETSGLTPRELADRLGLTAGSATTMLDRLEKVGYVTRSAHPTDRRKLLVHATATARERAFELIGPLVAEGERTLLSRYSAEQLELITEFLASAAELQRQHVARLRGV
ncbi:MULTISPECIES: MarR family transcriptional regulator [Mycolicibacterium]|uniref:MarR family transcriptional regulator n=1 Tax=Mycolicibacterium TaxID=1866885 RepID=UPI000FBF8D56|nr:MULTISPECIES: MarR family transcriptional regulator [Mycolicibacterium]RUP30171.1 MAG: MarR family transcriptional regulator [Mycolicibacterium sp.]UCZ61837.1 MarR family transcriptional regulator [Mycolicibacterium phocaicum]